MINYVFLIFLLSFEALLAADLSKDIYINSENIFYDKENETIKLGKDSLIDYQNATIGTNNALINNKTKIITIQDKFYINSIGDIMKGEFYQGNLDFTEGEASNINYLYQNQLKINSKSLWKNNNRK